MALRPESGLQMHPILRYQLSIGRRADDSDDDPSSFNERTPVREFSRTAAIRGLRFVYHESIILIPIY